MEGSAGEGGIDSGDVREFECPMTGRWKTLELVSHNYWWPQMFRYVSKYVSTCDMCLCTKALHQPLVGKLNLLPVPDAPWDVVSVDFISKLLEANGKDCVRGCP